MFIRFRCGPGPGNGSRPFGPVGRRRAAPADCHPMARACCSSTPWRRPGARHARPRSLRSRRSELRHVGRRQPPSLRAPTARACTNVCEWSRGSRTRGSGTRATDCRASARLRITRGARHSTVQCHRRSSDCLRPTSWARTWRSPPSVSPRVARPHPIGHRAKVLPAWLPYRATGGTHSNRGRDRAASSARSSTRRAARSSAGSSASPKAFRGTVMSSWCRSTA